MSPEDKLAEVRLRGAVKEGERLVFVGGPPRSGTTLVQNVLDSHPEILGTPELLHFPDVLKLRALFLGSVRRGFLEFFCESEDVDCAAYAFIDRMLGPVIEESSARYISEKTPGNALVFGQISELLPRARFIFVIRDPRAIVSSMMRIGDRARAKGVSLGVHMESPRAALKEVKNLLRSGFSHASERPGRCCVVKYEDLTTDPETVTRRLCDFLGLEWSESMLYPERHQHLGEEPATREGVWYEPAEFRRALVADRNDAWRKELNAAAQIMVARAFRNDEWMLEAGYSFDSVPAGLKGIAGRVAWGSGALAHRLRRRLAPS